MQAWDSVLLAGYFKGCAHVTARYPSFWRKESPFTLVPLFAIPHRAIYEQMEHLIEDLHQLTQIVNYVGQRLVAGSRYLYAE